MDSAELSSELLYPILPKLQAVNQLGMFQFLAKTMSLGLHAQGLPPVETAVARL